ncbi:zinc-binding dehydrogenase [Acrocarpospora macrocephala]|uniref:Alcohol dehydrogenase n=1 Tax=Acrocarpospora macrocephala TaxID=150177 RepID=A0A5M3WQ98_9ACTN|nr:zinc-binding dehydrogenase [Acrocarpospora macrocephala]GES11527.1 alcohol dehydrogenase [Acrocarpospora macrocephala]
MTGPCSFETVEIPAPVPDDLADGEVLLQVLAGGLCGTDRPYYQGSVSTWAESDDLIPGFPMHEIVGEVVAARTTDHQVGDRVVGWATRLNGLQELIITEGSSVHAYDSSLRPAEAIALQPLACVIYAVERLGDVSGQHCAVIGQGPIGVLFSHVLKNARARKVTGVDRIDRRDILGDFGVDDPVFLSSGRWAAALTDDEDRPDVIVEAVGHQVSTLTHAVAAARPLGRILYFGVPDDSVYPIDMEKMVRKHLTLISGSTLERRRVLAAAGEYVKAHPDLIRTLVTHEFKVDATAEAYRTAFTPMSGQLKVVITMGD